MTSSIEPSFDPHASMSPAPPPEQRQLRIAFTGSGSEYFRIWIVNLLLTLVTVGLYYPWAKVRRLRYFYGNTLVDGAALDFHGNPRKMLKGTLLVALLFGLYSVAGHFSSVAGLVALVLLAAVMPELLRASLQFRLANTSWRGLRFYFKGNTADAYRAVLPMYLPTILLFGLTALSPEVDNHKAPLWLGLSILGLGLLTLLMFPWSFWKFKQYQHNHYALAHLQTRFNAPTSAFYKLGRNMIGWGVLAGALIPLTVMFLFWINKPNFNGGTLQNSLMGLLPLVLMLGVFIAIKPYAIARTQNLVWNHTGNDDLQFHSNLRFKPMFGLTLKNWLLVLLTLGLYWPFAAVAMARIRLQAASIVTHIDPDTLLGQPAGNTSAAVGDAAGDMLGIDFGL
ncbi:YjgN family protein [Rhodoferax sp.]|uniref:YjgN family protein n=1 Tax=Rhodoferax sp. TaxID=50421 RepID=UPI00374D851E